MFLFWKAHLKVVMSIYISIPELQNDQIFSDFFFFFCCEAWILTAIISLLF